MGDPQQAFHRLYPPLNFCHQPAVLGRPVANETPKEPTPENDPYPHATEKLLHPFHVPWVHDEDTLGWFWELALRWPPHLQVPEVLHDVPNPPPPLSHHPHKMVG